MDHDEIQRVRAVLHLLRDHPPKRASGNKEVSCVVCFACHRRTQLTLNSRIPLCEPMGIPSWTGIIIWIQRNPSVSIIRHILIDWFSARLSSAK